MTRVLAMLVFISSCMTALCLALLTYTYATGNMPFGIKPVISYEQQLASKIAKDKKGMRGKPGTVQRFNEQYLNDFYNQTMALKKNLLKEQEKLSQERESLESIANNNKKLQAEIKKQEDKLNKMIDKIKTEDIERVGKLAKLIGGMDVAQATTMLLAFDDNMACRILYKMNQKTASKITAEVIKNGDPESVKRIQKIADDMSKLNEDLSNE